MGLSSVTRRPALLGLPESNRPASQRALVQQPVAFRRVRRYANISPRWNVSRKYSVATRVTFSTLEVSLLYKVRR